MVHLQCHGPTSDTPIASAKYTSTWAQVRSAEITAAIRAIITEAGPSIRFTASDISAYFLRTGVAMALLLDPDTIHLVGRWRSKIILHYLHITTKSFTIGLEVRMLQHGDYALIPPEHAGF